MTRRARTQAVAIVVPVHDEELLLPRCLESVRRAVDRLAGAPGGGVAATVVVVLDGCTDRSSVVAEPFGFPTLMLPGEGVGAARAAGYRFALEHLAGSAHVDLSRVWLVATDADSEVPPHWLTTQLALARAGADVVVGTVRPDPADLTPQQLAAWRARHTPGLPNGHVHGANLGMRADLYEAVGGFPSVLEHEDVLLVGRLRALGAHVVASDACWVLTSGRSVGRTPGGYARFLRDDLLTAGAARPVP